VPTPTKLEVAQQLWRRDEKDIQGKRHRIMWKEKWKDIEEMILGGGVGMNNKESRVRIYGQMS
jgi:hypothetical protein